MSFECLYSNCLYSQMIKVLPFNSSQEETLDFVSIEGLRKKNEHREGRKYIAYFAEMSDIYLEDGEGQEGWV